MYEPAIIDEVKLMCEDFTITIIIEYVRLSRLPLRAYEWVLVAGLGGILLVTSGESKEHDSEEHEDVL